MAVAQLQQLPSPEPQQLIQRGTRLLLVSVHRLTPPLRASSSSRPLPPCISCGVKRVPSLAVSSITIVTPPTPPFYLMLVVLLMRLVCLEACGATRTSNALSFPKSTRRHGQRRMMHLHLQVSSLGGAWLTHMTVAVREAVQ